MPELTEIAFRRSPAIRPQKNFQTNQLRAMRCWVYLNFCLLLLVAGNGCRWERGGNSGAGDSAGVSKRDSTGLWKSGLIDGASMAPFLKGQHFSLRCPTCRYPFAVGAPLERSATMTCPNCGHQWKALATASIDVVPESSDRVRFAPVEIDQTPRRWERIVRQYGDEFMVKRVVGLPGESIGFDRGDVLVDGRRMVKPWGLQKENWLPVYDSDFSDRRVDRILSAQGGLILPFQLGGENLGFRYRHVACYNSKRRRQTEVIKDSYGYNQTLTRSLNSVGDIGILLVFAQAVDPVFVIELQTEKYGMVHFVSRLGKMGRFFSVHQPEAPQSDSQPVPFSWEVGPRSELVVCLIDGMARIIVDDCLVLQRRLILAKKTSLISGDQQVRVPVLSAAEGELSRVKIFRDLFYFDRLPDRLFVLKPREFFLLGDNLPMSADSRGRSRPVQRSELIGILD